METEKLIQSIGRIAWATLFLFLDININGISLLPEFVGYLMILSAIDGLVSKVREIGLLKPLALMLTIWYGLGWFAAFAGVDIHNSILAVSLLMTVVSVYFYFQLLSDIAIIAKEVQSETADTDRRILLWRNVQLILTTLSSLIVYFTAASTLQGVIGVIALFLILGTAVSCIGIILTLFDLKKQLK